ncbi:DNA cytosine methyltransferase [Paenibacillus mesophilus]|uniref:DNA cytosine methyltransferase n=1 Tax=Paenibacillus mesophilus TaxID=2582849 RepID=UPI00110D92D0|nr:DNA cytosine methyltransferase [Paenibacillus mesophilus]TMV49385.1 DNA cytosine methyltransferase [Paenibacillus mesophilus]
MSEKITAIFPFCGLGGGAIGALMARPEAFGVTGQVEVVCGMDVDPDACRNFEVFTGAPCYQFDFFSRQQYIDWHGHEPPEDWRELTPDDIWRACNYKTPDFSFRSAPCKGFTGLLGGKKSKSKKYQALNQLALRETELTLKAFEHDPIPVMLMENVPGIQTRGKDVLDRLKKMMVDAGYLLSESVFCCGEIGGLGARRKRYILIARHPDKCPAEILEPAKLPLKTIGDVIGPLPMPGDIAAGGRHHREPMLSWLVALRLATIPAGKDWRALEDLDWWKLRVQHEPRNGAYGVEEWDKPSRAITGAADPGRSNSATAISDPRTGYKPETHGNIYRLYRFDEIGPSITGAVGPNNGAACIADPRIHHDVNKQGNAYRISRIDEPAPVVTGSRLGSGGIAINDPRIEGSPYHDTYKVSEWDKAGRTVTSGGGPSSGAPVISDPRVNKWAGKYPGTYKVSDWETPASTIIGQTDIQTGALSVSDPRVKTELYPDCYGVQQWNEPAKTIRATERVMQSACSIADPRVTCSPRNGTYGVMKWDAAAPTVTGGDVHSGASAIADPRAPDDYERGVWIIISLDGTRHRALTTFELAMLQGMPQYMRDGRPFELVGVKSDKKAREYIGNLVPPPSAKGWIEEIGAALICSRQGITFRMSYQPVWVAPEEDEQRAAVLH